jgi:hypothetical protein
MLDTLIILMVKGYITLMKFVPVQDTFYAVLIVKVVLWRFRYKTVHFEK